MKTILYILAIVCCTNLASAQDSLKLSETDFMRYATGLECAQASSWWENLFWRDKRPDTTYFPPTGYPTQRSTKETVSKCLSHLSMLSTQQRDLLGLVKGYLKAGQGAKADSVTARLISLLSAPSATQLKGWLMFHLVDIYLGNDEPKLAKAQELIRQMDEMGQSLGLQRMLAHQKLGDAAIFGDNLPIWESELNKALAISKQLPFETRREYAGEIVGIYAGLANYKARLNDPKGAVEIINSGRPDIGPVRTPVLRYLNVLAGAYIEMGKPAQLIQATRWFNTNGNNVHPAPGRPALIHFVNHNCGGACYEEYSVLKRLRAKFESRGLDIVLVASTQGYYRNRLVKADSEMVIIDNYFTRYLDLPFNLAVWQTDFGIRDDGKLVVKTFPNEEAYSGETYLIDSKGLIRMGTILSRRNETMLRNVIEEMLVGGKPPTVLNLP